MSTSTEERTTSTTRADRSLWTCPNCRHQTHAPRKRCRECGTSRY